MFAIIQKTINAYGTVTQEIVGVAETKKIAEKAVKRFQPIIDALTNIDGVQVESTLEIQEVSLLREEEF